MAALGMGLGLSSPAAANPTNCQTVGKSTVCGQGSLNGAGESTQTSTVSAPSNSSGCTNVYGNYQRC